MGTFVKALDIHNGIKVSEWEVFKKIWSFEVIFCQPLNGEVFVFRIRTKCKTYLYPEIFVVFVALCSNIDTVSVVGRRPFKLN